MKKILTIITAAMLASCAAHDMSSAIQKGRGNIPTHQFSSATTVEQVRSLKPQASPPLKIAVFPPNRWQSVGLEERKLIEKWGDKLKTIGFVKSLEIVPESLMPACGYRSDAGCYLNEARVAGARLGADAILFLDDSTVTDAYVNPASILNLTIVGMWIVPAHHRDSYSIYEASLFDIDNGYLYAVAESYGEFKTVRPFMYIEYETGQKEARLIALEKLGQKLLDRANEFMSAVESPNHVLKAQPSAAASAAP